MKRFPIDFLQPYEKSPKNLNVVVETPKGSRVKYAYDKKRGMFIISKALPEGMVFPFNFGFVPGTLAADGDPLEVMVLNEEPVVSNTLLNVRPLAVIKATQSEKEGAKPCYPAWEYQPRLIAYLGYDPFPGLMPAKPKGN